MISRRRLLVAQAFWFLAGCGLTQAPQTGINKLTIGVIAYGEGGGSVDHYERFIDYLEGQVKAIAELEPAYNEIQAMEQIRRRAWSLVFAPPGLAAIAVAKAQYTPLFPLEGVDNLSSALIVLKDSPIEKLSDVNGQILALGQPGSATGYYVPLYELYGTTPAEVRIAPTPKTVLQWIADGDVGIGAMSKDEFERYRSEFSGAQFTVLHTSRRIPSGSVLVSSTVEANQQDLIQNAMENVVPAIAQEVGYIPNADPPDYKLLIDFIKKVEPIESRIREKPAPLYKPGEQVRPPGG
ncbi:MAG TPA: PhnD/SsuA/transferrin family substrate-binding protein [Crinalium sp.]